MKNNDQLVVRIIKHEDIDSSMIDRITKLKRQYWNYPYDSQISWLNTNLAFDDVHLCITDKDEILMSYLNLININITLDSKQFKVIGIGNVCVDKNYVGIGMGKVLMSIVEYYLKGQGKVGILLCKNRLVGFYEKTNWHVMKKSNLTKVLIANNKYNGEVMFSIPDFCTANIVTVDKNF